MTRFHVKFQVEGQACASEVDLQVDDIEIDGDIVLRALAGHLYPDQAWPLALPDTRGLTPQAARLCHTQAARRHLGLVHLVYRPEGRVLDLTV